MQDLIGMLLQDFHDQLYEEYHLNFISPITRQKLEDLALSAIQNDIVPAVSKVQLIQNSICYCLLFY